MEWALSISRKRAEEIRDPLFILPLGSIEQHGNHLPLGTDTYIAEAIAERAAEGIEHSVILPTLSITYSWSWKGIPFSLYIKESSLKELLKEIARSSTQYNPKAFVVINAHLANDSAIKYAARDLSEELPDLRFFYFSYPPLEMLERDSEPSFTIHAEEIETSLMLYIKPDLVDMSQAVKEYPSKPKGYGKKAMVLGGLSRSGSFGDPTVASADKGRTYLETMANWIIETLKEEGVI